MDPTEKNMKKKKKPFIPHINTKFDKKWLKKLGELGKN